MPFSGTEPEQVAFGLQALAELTTNLQLVQAADREFTKNVSVIVWQVARSAALIVLMNAVEQHGGTSGSGGSMALPASVSQRSAGPLR